MYDFSVERNVTSVYRQYENAHTAVREIKCMEQMYPQLLCDIRPGDRFAGRIRLSYVGFSPEPGGLGFFCNRKEIEKILAQGDLTEELRAEATELLRFWQGKTTAEQVRQAYSQELAKALPSDDWEGESLAAAPLYRMAGSYLDYEKLLKNGISGLKEILREQKQRGGDEVLFSSMEAALELLETCCRYYRDQAENQMDSAKNPEHRNQMAAIAASLQRILAGTPQTMQDAIQLMWLYILISGTFNYGRVDVLLGDFLQRDLEQGVLTMETAQELMNGFWQLIADRKTTWNGRVVLGGRGRRNEENADRVALLAMEATRVVAEIEPQLTLRLYDGMNPLLLEKAIEVIGAGRTYPMLYNDDVNIPAVEHAFRLPRQEAEQYVPFGCGEYVIDHKSVGTPSGVINLLRVLELTLRGGKDPVTGQQVGVKTKTLEEMTSFDQLWDAYKVQTEYFVAALAQQEALEYRVCGQTAPFLFFSILYDDCIERGKGIFAGGVEYLGGTLETYGNINTADSLTAIRNLVFEKKSITKSQLMQALDSDFEGFEAEKQQLLQMPKYGNDDAGADAMAVQLHDFVCNLVRDQAAKVGLHSYLVVIINNSANTTMGRHTGASADGRGRGIYMANGNNPWGGNDKKGLTAMLNSLVKLRPDIHAGAVQNMKFSPELFQNGGVLVKSVLKTYFENGGTQAMISVVNRKDLEQAMIHPERYGHVFVRVGGFSARFVELERGVQLEILSRTLYGA